MESRNDSLLQGGDMLELTVAQHLMLDVPKDGFQGHQPGAARGQGADEQTRQALCFGALVVGSNPVLGSPGGVQAALSQNSTMKRLPRACQ